MRQRLGILALAATAVTASVALACLPTYHLASDQELNDYLDGLSFVAEGRIGIPGAGDFELDLGPDTGAPFTTAEYTWPNGTPVDFCLEVVPNGPNLDVTFTTDPLGANETVLQYSLPADPNTSVIVVRTRAVDGGSSILVDDMTFNGDAVCDSSFGDGDASGLDLMVIEDFGLNTGFTLKGSATLSWTGTAPTRSRLAYQIKVGNPAPLPVRPVSWGELKRTF